MSDVESGYLRLLDGFPDPAEPISAGEVKSALDTAARSYDHSLSIIASAAGQAALTPAQTEDFEATVARAEDALQVALKAARQKVRMWTMFFFYENTLQ